MVENQWYPIKVNFSMSYRIFSSGTSWFFQIWIPCRTIGSAYVLVRSSIPWSTCREEYPAGEKAPYFGDKKNFFFGPPDCFNKDWKFFYLKFQVDEIPWNPYFSYFSDSSSLILVGWTPIFHVRKKNISDECGPNKVINHLQNHHIYIDRERERWYGCHSQSFVVYSFAFPTLYGGFLK